LSFPYVQAYHDYGEAKGPRLGISWHMAEGGGTVGFLSRPNGNGVSVHFVIEASGNTVQMLPLSHANGSLRPTAIRTTDDPPYLWQGDPITYGATAAGAVLGDWHKDPNSATIGVEIEGFAKDGPNAAQGVAMAYLWGYLDGKYPGIRSLAHRDFADYKGCPGKRIPWGSVGGHGKEVEMKAVTDETPAEITVSKGTAYRDLDGVTVLTIGQSALGWRPSPYASGSLRAMYATVGNRRLVLVNPSGVRPVPVPDADAAYNAGLDAAATAVGAIPRK
jgi:hypothetical protein